MMSCHCLATSLVLCHPGEFLCVCVCIVRSQVVDDVTQFYKETYKKYKEDKQEALREMLHLIQYGVSSDPLILCLSLSLRRSEPL